MRVRLDIQVTEVYLVAYSLFMRRVIFELPVRDDEVPKCQLRDSNYERGVAYPVLRILGTIGLRAVPVICLA